MENNKDLKKELYDKIKEPIVPEETISNSMTTRKDTFSIMWRPNNYRRQIEVKLKDNSTMENIKSAIKGTIPNPHTKMISIKNYKPNITIQYGKNTLTGIYSQNIIGGEKEIFLIEANTIDDLEERINQIKAQIQEKIDDALDSFINRFNLRIPLKTPIWSRYEDFIKGDEYIDKIPREVIIHDTYFKNVYDEGLEFKNTKKGEEPTVHMKNYIKNRAIEDIAPGIAEELKANREMSKMILDINASTSKVLNDFIVKFLPLQQDFAVNIGSHTKVIKNMVKATNELRRAIKEKQSKLGDFN